MTSQSKSQKQDTAKIKAAILRAYKAGYREGANERNKFLNCLKTTNNNLWQELCRLDRDEPCEGIWISVSFAEKLADALPKKHSGSAKELRKKIRLSNQRFDKHLKFLKRLKDYK